MDQVVLKQTSGYTKTGSDYAGYLLVITDERGEKILIASNEKKFQKNAAKFSGFKTGSAFCPDSLEPVKKP